MQSRRGALSRLRNATFIPLDKLEALESDHKHRIDVETQAVNQALAMFLTPCYICTTNTKYTPMQHHTTHIIENLKCDISDIFSNSTYVYIGIYKIVLYKCC